MEANACWELLIEEIGPDRFARIDSKRFPGISFCKDAFAESLSNISTIRFLRHLENQFVHVQYIRIRRF